MVRTVPIRVTAAFATALALSLALAGWPGDARAGRADAELRVTARIPVTLDLRVSEQAPAVTLTDADLAAGVKDVPSATVLEVRTNSDLGYVLELGLPDAPWLADVEVHAAGAAVRGLPGDLVHIAVPTAGTGTSLTPLDLRLRLAPGAAPGTYALPLALGLAPL